jgi:hypothetical protein
LNRANNPFAPGAGHQPPELAGRDRIIEDASAALARIIKGRPDRGHILLGLRGVGKTVLLNRIEKIALELGYHVALIEAPEEASRGAPSSEAEGDSGQAQPAGAGQGSGAPGAGSAPQLRARLQDHTWRR